MLNIDDIQKDAQISLALSSSFFFVSSIVDLFLRLIEIVHTRIFLSLSHYPTCHTAFK